VDLDAFVSEHGREWDRLQALTAKRRGRLTAAEIDDLIVLYRRTATHLSVVRSRSPDPALVALLTRLVLQARAAVTPSAGLSWAAVGRFFTVTFPLETYRAMRWWVGVAAGFIGFTGVILTIIANDPNRAVPLLGGETISDLVNHDFQDYYSQAPPQDFAVGVWTNNALLTGLCLAAGVLVIPVFVVLFQNAMNTGVIGGVMVGYHRGDVFFGLITIHGLLELTCVFIAAGVGLRIGWAWIAPGPWRGRGQALAQTGRSAMVVALGLVLALAVSGLVEAFVTPAPVLLAAKLVIGATVWTAFLVYIVLLGGLAARRGASADVADFEREPDAPTV
jgi:uncharacterized membrane protein SpoIIM required for sporulation